MKHIDAIAHTRGESQYVDDMPQPAGMLYAAVYVSPVAHGKLKSVDLEDALATEGVVTVLLAKDIPGSNNYGNIIQDDRVLAQDDVTFVGEPIAIVVAVTPEIAKKGVKLVHADIEELPAIFDPREAFQKNQLIGVPHTFVLGDVDSTWAKCDVVVEGTCETGAQEHVYLETQRARAIPLEGGCMRVHAATQSPTVDQRVIARMLGVPFNYVEIDVKRLGGAFGGKEDQAAEWSAVAALAAWHTKKPVEIVLSRADDIRMTGKRHPYSSDFKIGLSKDGKILAYDVKMYQNAGATADLSPAILARSLFHATNAYYIPNVRAFAVSCKTNLLSNTAFRGFGSPQGMFVIEAALAKAAEEMHVSREELQYKNLLREGDIFPFHQHVKNCRTHLTWDTADKNFHLAEIKSRVEDYNQRHFESKMGYAAMPICFGVSFTNSLLNQASALVHVYTDGSVSVSTNAVEMGQGVSSKIAGIVVKTFGIQEHRVKVESTNTTRTVNMSPSAASSTADLNGNATLIAVRQIVERLKAVAAQCLNLADKDKVTVSEEKVLYEGKATGWNWNKLIEMAYVNRVALSAHGYYATPNIWFDMKKEEGEPFAYHVFGTAFIEVMVDCLRGTYDITSVKVVHDVGRSLNELIDQGQIEGGLAQGLGWMTLEEIRFNAKGQLVANALANYKVPDVHFMPEDVRVKFLENVDNPPGPYDSKAIGEPPFLYGIGAFFAIRYAMQAFRPNYKFALVAPLTPERVALELYNDFVQELKSKAGKK